MDIVKDAILMAMQDAVDDCDIDAVGSWSPDGVLEVWPVDVDAPVRITVA